MSTERDDDELMVAGVPELTPLGTRIELLRLERRMSKRVLAHRAGTSRQQLWRVMTGKSELTSSLCARLSEVLEVDSRELRDATFATGVAGAPRPHAPKICQTLEEYVSDSDGLERTFQTLPATADGRRLKRVLLDTIEDIAITRAIKLPQSVFDLRRGIVNDET